MSEALTLLSSQFKGDLHSGTDCRLFRSAIYGFPSYFSNYWPFERSCLLRMEEALPKRRLSLKRGSPPVTAFVAIV
jgi:hypothetical protein